MRTLSPPPPLADGSTRNQILFTGILGMGTSLLYFVPHLPFGRTFYALGLLSGLVHLTVYFFIRDFTRKIKTVMFVFNGILLGGVVHYTGGIISPFIFIFFCLIVTASAQDMYPVFNLVMTLLIFTSIVAAEYLGWVPVWNISTTQTYASWPATVLVSVTIIGFMFLSAVIYQVVLDYLKSQVEQEQAMKQRYMNMLSKLDAASQVGLLVNKIVHDVRGPLGAVAGFIKMFHKEPALTDQAREDCEIILNELERISRLVNQMIKYTKPGTSMRDQICPVDLIETVLSVISFHPASRGVQIKRRFTKPNTYWIQANKEELQQAYFNIVKNALEAIEANPEERRIEIEIQVKISDIAIEIEDNGPGIPPELLKTLLKETVSTKKEGAGVGLVIVREIIQGHGGKVSIDSVPGQGTRIRTQIPLATLGGVS